MRKFGYIAIFITAILWGISFISTKILLEIMVPSQIIFMRYFIANFAFVAIMITRKISFKVEKKDWWLFLATTFFGIVLYLIFEARGLERLNATTATLILSLIPIFIMFLNRFTKADQLTNRKRLAVIGSVIGVYLVVQGESGTNEFMGYIYMFLCVISWVFYTIYTNKLTEKYNEIKVAAVQSYIGSFFFLPVVFSNSFDLTVLDSIHWLHITFLGLACSAGAFTLYVYAVKVIGNTISSLVINFIPLVTLVAGYIFLGETLTTIQLVGGTIILSVMALAISDDKEIHVEIR